jgi:hypothetical protein
MPRKVLRKGKYKPGFRSLPLISSSSKALMQQTLGKSTIFFKVSP